MVKASNAILIILAILFPPAAAGLIRGCSGSLFVNICLTVLGYLPGNVHALLLVFTRIQAQNRYRRGAFHHIGNDRYKWVPTSGLTISKSS